MSFGGFYGAADDETSLRTLAEALDLGVDFWDVADVYGNGRCESLIGEFFRGHPGSRRRVTLATKFAIRRTPDATRVQDNSAKYMAECLEASLKRLGVERIDLYYVHCIDASIPIEETVGALAKHVDSGKIGAIGLSEMAPDTLRRAAGVHPIAAMQSEYSLWTRNAEIGLLQACEEVQTTFVAFSPLGRAFFTGKLQDVETFPAGDFRANNPRFLGLNWRRNRDKLAGYLDYARTRGVCPAALAIAWTLAKAPHIVPIPGTRSPEHLIEFAAGGDLEVSAAEVAEVERLLPVGFAAGERYAGTHWVGIETY
jgi:aryl-alcohol dehydrogenase-like predicted oxidoreductase